VGNPIPPIHQKFKLPLQSLILRLKENLELVAQCPVESGNQFAQFSRGGIPDVA